MYTQTRARNQTRTQKITNLQGKVSKIMSTTQRKTKATGKILNGRNTESTGKSATKYDKMRRGTR
jgi:hypothetical protein